MRISDWSSDVCSSDQRDLEPGARGAQLETLKVFQCANGLARMQEHFGGADEQRNGDDIELLHAPLGLQLGTAIAIQPMQHLLRVERPSVAAEENRCRLCTDRKSTRLKSSH